MTLLVLIFVPNSYAYQRVVLLAPAAGDIFIKLNAQDKVVGVTRSNDDFPNALKIGSHIKPNIELLKGLEPDLLVISSNRFFSEHLSQKIAADVIKYDPTNLDDILVEIETLGEILDRKQQAEKLIKQMVDLRNQIKPIATAPKVVFEVTESPFIIAGQLSIVQGIISAAGGQLIAPSNRKLVKYNVESVLVENPDYYLYQVGPMNKKPTPPSQRANFSMMKGQVIKVDQLEFSRANTHSFELALDMNKQFIH
ncbi:ABC transporter substrate-binding protein [Vibrio sp. MA40-2]|uniref:ABC transporter substrate-binding protein n=1 Tax=Vibrio sp. MA40-2 TaxID=3391828 RepID=UPI0039A5C533